MLKTHQSHRSRTDSAIRAHINDPVMYSWPKYVSSSIICCLDATGLASTCAMDDKQARAADTLSLPARRSYKHPQTANMAYTHDSPRQGGSKNHLGRIYESLSGLMPSIGWQFNRLKGYIFPQVSP